VAHLSFNFDAVYFNFNCLLPLIAQIEEKLPTILQLIFLF